MKEHYKSNQKIYEISIEEGFNKMKAVISEHRNELKEWVQNLPENLLMRIVPIDTITFQSILRNKVLDQSEELVFTINQSTNIEVLEKKETISKKETDLDVLHHDVPFFQIDLQGNCYYQGKIFWQFSQSCQKLIKDKIDDIESLEIPESFRETIRLPITHD